MRTRQPILLNNMRALNWLTLFSSSATLICCALPALLVSLGLGAVLIGLVSYVPQLIWISEHKAIVFGVAAVLLTLAGMMQWVASKLPCPTDKQLAQRCTAMRKQSSRIYLVACGLYFIGVWFAFIAPYWID